MPIPTTSSRRSFLTRALAAAATVAGAALPAAAQTICASPRVKAVKIYRLSLRGRRGSRAAKAHCANLRFASPMIAEQHRAHAGDRSRVVSILVSREEYLRLFVKPGPLGRRLFTPVADLRHV